MSASDDESPNSGTAGGPLDEYTTPVDDEGNTVIRRPLHVITLIITSSKCT